MADNVIKEFLVSLGFKIDDAGQKKFTGAVNDAGKTTDDLGVTLKDVGGGLEVFAAAFAAAAAAVVVSVTKIASGLDQLYFQSKQVSATAAEIRGLGYAFSQLGGSASDAQSALYSLANFRRHFGRGADSALTTFGVDPSHLNDSFQSLMDLQKRFQAMAAHGQEAQAYAIGSVFGLGDKQMFMLLQDNGRALKEYNDIIAQSGFNMEHAAEQANTYMSNLRETGAEFDLMKDEIGNEFLPVFNEAAQDILKWINALETGGKLSGFSGDLLEVVRAFSHLAHSINDVVVAISGMSTGNFIATFARDAIHAITDVISTFSYFIDMLIDVGRGDFRKAGADAHSAGVAGRNLAIDLIGKDSERGAIPGESPQPLAMGGMSTGSSSPHLSGSAGDAVSYFQKLGASQAGAQGLVSALFSESRLNTNASNKSGAYGLAQWLSPDRVANFQKVIGHSLYGSSRADQMRFIGWELKNDHRFAGVWNTLKSTGSSALAAITAIGGYEGLSKSPGQAMSDAGRAGRFLGQDLTGKMQSYLGAGGGVNMTQNNYFNAHGSDSASLTHQIAAHQEVANQRLFANLTTLAQ